jgi:hypothetical protein
MSAVDPKPQNDKTLNTIRGKNLVGHATKADIDKLFEHIDALEMFLDEADHEDTFGTEGWRHSIGVPD